MVPFMGCVPVVNHPDSGSVALGKPYHGSISRKDDDDMTTQHHRVITKILVSAAIALGSYVGGAAPASADPNPILTDPNPILTDPNPFGALSCSCRETVPPGSPARREEMERGIRAGLSASPDNRSHV
jgi:hypothetical protein